MLSSQNEIYIVWTIVPGWVLRIEQQKAGNKGILGYYTVRAIKIEIQHGVEKNIAHATSISDEVPQTPHGSRIEPWRNTWLQVIKHDIAGCFFD